MTIKDLLLKLGIYLGCMSPFSIPAFIILANPGNRDALFIGTILAAGIGVVMGIGIVFLFVSLLDDSPPFRTESSTAEGSPEVLGFLILAPVAIFEFPIAWLIKLVICLVRNKRVTK